MKYNQLIIPDKLREDVIHYFKTEQNNSVPDIMKAFDIKNNVASNIINKYLDSLKKTKNE